MSSTCVSCPVCPLSLLCLGGQLQLTRCRNCQRLFVYSVDLHLIGYPHGDKKWPEGFFTEGSDDCLVETPLNLRNSCPRCQPLQWSWQWEASTQRSRRQWRIIACDLDPGL